MTSNNNNHPQHQQGGSASSFFHLRGTHLSLLLDDIVRSPTGLQDALQYLESIAPTATASATTTKVTTQQAPVIVESVFVKGAMSRDAPRIPETTAVVLFKALSTCLPHIERLEVSGDGRFGGLFLPVKAMTAALQQSCRNQLTSLRLGMVVLTTSTTTTTNTTTTTMATTHSSRAAKTADMQALAMALQKLPKLTKFDLVRCRSEDSQCHLGPLVQAIAAMPHLQQAMFCETIISTRTGLYLGELCQSSSIQKLWWKTMPGTTDDHIAHMVRHLKTNTVLRELTIRSHGLGQASGQAIADLLRHNTTLQVVNLDLDQATHGLVIAKALHHNTSLKCLDVWAWDSNNNNNNNAENHMLATSSAEEQSRIITKVFTDMLQSNWVLQFLTYQGLDWTNPQVDFYLRLNRAGRQRLLQNFDNKVDWTNALLKQKEDVPVVYHFLSLNPSIVTAAVDGGYNRKRNCDHTTAGSCSSSKRKNSDVVQLSPFKKR